MDNDATNKITEKSILKLFDDDKTRLSKMTKKINIFEDSLFVDYSKTHLTEKDFLLYLNDFESELSLKDRIEEMFTGQKINFTEDKKVLHVSLRNENVIKKIEGDQTIQLENENLESYNELVKIRDFTNKLHNEELKGVTGQPLNTIVNIGIGGSDLGPKMICEGLGFYRNKKMSVHFISNVDSTDTLQVFDKINPETTLFIVVSKTFTTQETLENAKLVKTILLKKHFGPKNIEEEEIVKHHFVAVSSNNEEVKKFGIETVFKMGGYVGGRYSLWSSVGLSISLYLGFNNFLLLLKGANIMDVHFRTSDLKDNMPLFHSIVEIFYNNQCGFNNKAILPYDQYLSKLPAYLQQAEMESNGKTAIRTEKENNKKINAKTNKNTGMIIWGEPGTNSQHSFFQLIHQGTRNILSEFIVGLKPLGLHCPLKDKHHTLLFANCVAQTEALMTGRENKEDLHRDFKGNKPSITIVYSKLTPATLGALVALYEHKIFVQGIFWGINSYDQFGVELGKHLAKQVYKDLTDKEIAEHDPSTLALISLKKENDDESS